MELSKTGFWASLYRGSRKLRNNFLHKDAWYRDPYHDLDRTDLCTFVRSVFVWGPLMVVANAAVVAWALFSVAFLVKALFPHFLTIGWMILCSLGIAALVGLVIALCIGSTSLWQKFDKSETATLTKNYIRAKKSKICPIIDFKGTTNANA